MPSFDISSDVNWQEIDNAIQQALREANQRFDFKGVRSEIEWERKEKKIVLWTSHPEKLEALNDILQSKLVKRGVSLLALEYEKEEAAFGSSARQPITIQAGLSQEKAKKVIASIKETRLKVQAQIQDEQVRVTGKSRDDLQALMAHLKTQQEKLQVPLQFGNFRDSP